MRTETIEIQVPRTDLTAEVEFEYQRPEPPWPAQVDITEVRAYDGLHAKVDIIDALDPSVLDELADAVLLELLERPEGV